jgi:hypothetical protein
VARTVGIQTTTPAMVCSPHSKHGSPSNSRHLTGREGGFTPA